VRKLVERFAAILSGAESVFSACSIFRAERKGRSRRMLNMTLSVLGRRHDQIVMLHFLVA